MTRYGRKNANKGCMRKYLVQEHVPAGETVWNGYMGGKTTCTAPNTPGFYRLYELATDNIHSGWKWEPENGEDEK